MPQKGSKTSNGVNYTHSLSSNAWFGSYECRVHKAFLDRPGAELLTKQFKAGGYTWQFCLRHKTDGNLAAYLYNKNKSTVKVHFSFTIANQKQEKNELWGDVRAIKPAERWGDEDLMSIALIKDKSLGFLFENRFVVTLDLRVKDPSNEIHSLSTDENSGIYVWKLKNLCGMSPPVVLSDEFTVKGLKWGLEVYPYEFKNGKEYVSFYVYSFNRTPIQAEVTLTAINNAQPAMNIIHNDVHIFGTNGEEYGCSEFVESRAFEDAKHGFLKNGWITLTAHISLGPAKKKQTKKAVKQKESLKVAEEPECIFCLDKPQTSGVLHGDMVHKCYCLDCARLMKRRQGDLYCPICRQKVERIIEKIF